MSASRTLKTIAATAGLSATLVIAAGLALVASPGGTDEANADIQSFFLRDRTPQARFTDALAALGHEEPRPFDVNGNTVFVSVHHIEGNPMDIMRTYQQTFVREGVNSKTYLTVAETNTQDARFEGLTGGLVPLMIAPNHVSMGGVIARDNATDEQSLAKLARTTRRGNELFDGYRHVEIMRTPGQRFSTIVASFSAGDFDYNRMRPNAQTFSDASAFDVPACPGCIRLQSFSDLGEGDFTMTAYRSTSTPSEVVRFYEAAMARRGWTRLGDAEMHDRVEQLADQLHNTAHIRFSNGDKELSLQAIRAHDGSTHVIAGVQR